MFSLHPVEKVEFDVKMFSLCPVERVEFGVKMLCLYPVERVEFGVKILSLYPMEKVEFDGNIFFSISCGKGLIWRDKHGRSTTWTRDFLALAENVACV